jgi:hypothetical protein
MDFKLGVMDGALKDRETRLSAILSKLDTFRMEEAGQLMPSKDALRDFDSQDMVVTMRAISLLMDAKWKTSDSEETFRRRAAQAWTNERLPPHDIFCEAQNPVEKLRRIFGRKLQKEDVVRKAVNTAFWETRY